MIYPVKVILILYKKYYHYLWDVVSHTEPMNDGSRLLCVLSGNPYNKVVFGNRPKPASSNRQQQQKKKEPCSVSDEPYKVKHKKEVNMKRLDFSEDIFHTLAQMEDPSVSYRQTMGEAIRHA